MWTEEGWYYRLLGDIYRHETFDNLTALKGSARKKIEVRGLCLWRRDFRAVACWGHASADPPTLWPGHFAQLDRTAGADETYVVGYACALTVNGRIVCKGTTPPARVPTGTFSQISATTVVGLACALTVGGVIQVCGQLRASFYAFLHHFVQVSTGWLSRL